MLHIVVASVLLLATPGTLATAATAAADQPSHDTAFWQAIVKNEYVPPDADPKSVAALARELADFVSSPDPLWRDEFGYSILAAWITNKEIVPPDVMRELTARWSANLTRDIGSTNTDAVFRRSFSALLLSVIVAQDNTKPFLESGEVRALLAAALAYLRDERDIRGYDAQHGWMHSAAHTADLLKFLARSRYFTAADQPVLLDAIAHKLREAPEVFTHGEDGRFARAALSIVQRKDFDADGFTAWIARATPPRIRTALPDPALLRAHQNITNLFAKLEILLTMSEDASAPGVQRSRDALRSAMRTMF